MLKILVVMPFQDSHKSYVESLAPGCEFCYSSISEVTAEQVADADIIIGNAPAELVAQSQKLKWIQLNSAGADPYCKSGIIQPGTILTCATGAYGLTVSDGMLTDTLMLCRKMDLYMRNQTQNLWHSEGSVTTLWHSTVLVVGLGDIGCDYARKVKDLGATVIGVKRSISSKPDCVDELYTLDQLDELLPRADIVALVLPSTPQTYHIMNEDRLKRMKKGAYLINAGRGNAVDCEALNRVLRSGESLGGAALDVTEPEPLPADHPLWDAPRCIITPHVAGQFFLQETFERIVRIAGRNLEKFLAGDTASMGVQIDTATGLRKG